MNQLRPTNCKRAQNLQYKTYVFILSMCYTKVNCTCWHKGVKHLSSITKQILWHLCSSTRKENNSKPPTGENVVPRKRTIRVNPNEEKQGGIPEKGYPGIANPNGDQSWRQTELVLRCPRENSNEDPSWRQKELIPRHQQKQRGITKKESPGGFTPKYDPSWRQK